MALPGYRGLEGARLISLRLDNYVRSTGVGTCVEFKIIIRLCLVIKGWTKYSWRVDKGLHLRIMDNMFEREGNEGYKLRVWFGEG